MAQPPAYNRKKNFALNGGRETDHSALNAELDRASNSINDIRTNLAILQADDGKLRPFVVTADSISEELRVSLVEGVVMDAKAMLDESKAASEASSVSAEKAKESETAAAASADRASSIADRVQARADEIVESASREAQTGAGQAAASAKEAADIAAQTQQMGERIEERASEIAETAAGSAEAAEELAKEAKLHAEVANQRGIPVGTVVSVSGAVPVGYLLADGSAVGRKTYPDLFSVIGTRYGEGDGETTFNLPDLDRDISAIVPFASQAMPEDFLLCDGREVGREGYGDLFSVIGTTYGEGDGSTTFNVPDLIGRFAEGSATPGTVKEAGLPDAKGSTFGGVNANAGFTSFDGTFYKGEITNIAVASGSASGAGKLMFALSRSNAIYGNSDTVQPPALTVCYGIKARNRLASAIKAFDAAVDPGLVDLTELANEVKRNQTPVGTVAWFATLSPPASYLIADGSTVGRETYRKLFGAIGTTYGEGDGTTTFNLPNLIGRFAEGSATPGTVKEAGLPNITGSFDLANYNASRIGAIRTTSMGSYNQAGGSTSLKGTSVNNLDASWSNPIYGNSDTVQPPALTLLPCIKAFDGAVNTGLVDVTALANEVANKAGRDLSNTDPSKEFIETSVSWSAPDYSAALTVTLNNNNKTFTAPCDGYIQSGAAYANNLSGFLIVNSIKVSSYGGNYGNWDTVSAPLAKNDIVSYEGNDPMGLYFIPCKGAT